MSEHKAEVVEVNLSPHPNADKLLLARVWDYQVVVGKEEWEGAYRGMALPLGVYFPPDTLVPLDREEFAFLKGQRTPKVVEGREYHLLRAVRLRGQWSQGLLLMAPEGALPGQDLMSHFEALHWNPPEPQVNLRKQSASVRNKKRVPFVYDIEALLRHADAFVEGEPVWVTEKIHGANMRVRWDPNTKKVQVASRQFWLGEGEWRILENIKWIFSSRFWSLRKKRFYDGDKGEFTQRALFRNISRLFTQDMWYRFGTDTAWHQGVTPELEELCRDFPWLDFFGELYGPVQKGFPYDSPDKPKFILFDAWSGEDRKWVPFENLRAFAEVYCVPVVPASRGIFSLGTLRQMAEGKSEVPGANHIKEGLVVRPLEERTHPGLGRVILKLVGNAYLEKGA